MNQSAGSGAPGGEEENLNVSWLSPQSQLALFLEQKTKSQG